MLKGRGGGGLDHVKHADISGSHASGLVAVRGKDHKQNLNGVEGLNSFIDWVKIKGKYLGVCSSNANNKKCGLKWTVRGFWTVLGFTNLL